MLLKVKLFCVDFNILDLFLSTWFRIRRIRIQKPLNPDRVRDPKHRLWQPSLLRIGRLPLVGFIVQCALLAKVETRKSVIFLGYSLERLQPFMDILMSTFQQETEEGTCKEEEEASVSSSFLIFGSLGYIIFGSGFRNLRQLDPDPIREIWHLFESFHAIKLLTVKKICEKQFIYKIWNFFFTIN